MRSQACPAPHPDEIGREATPHRPWRDDVSPHEKRSGSVEEYDGRAGAGLAIGDEGVEDAELVNALVGRGRHGIARRQG